MKTLKQVYLKESRPSTSKLGGPGTASQGDGSTDGSASKPVGPQGSGGTGGMNSSSSGGPVLAMSESEELDVNTKRQKEDMQFEPQKESKTTMKVTKEQLQKLVVQEVRKRLTEAVDDPPREDWAKFGKKVDDFINDTIEKCDSLFKEGEDILYDKEDDDEGGDDKFRFISSRLGFLKSARSKLAQRFEGLRRED